MIPFLDLKKLHQLHAREIEEAVQRVVKSGWYILGPEVEAFEQEFAAYHGVDHAVAVANGTDAIELALRAADIGPGDEVITVSHTAMPTVTAIEATGATPILVDIEASTYTIDPIAIEAAITSRTKAIIPVHLYGHPADMAPIQQIASQHNLFILEDCAQAHGACYKKDRVGTLGHIAAFSFYPTKNLGAYGDGGAILTQDAALAARLRRLRFYGQDSRYTYVERGTNSRLDDIQAAILRVKLRYLDEHNSERRTIAKTYSDLLTQVVLPEEQSDCEHVYHLYVIRTPRRDELMKNLKERGIGTLIHYPVPIHLQESHHDLNYAKGSLPVTEQIVSEILSLPLYNSLEQQDVKIVAGSVNEVLA